MAQAGFTPISLYYSTTSTQEPAAADLVSGELAINIADGKLFYKNSGGNVRLLSIGYGSSTVTPTNGGVQYGTGTALALTAAGSSGQILRSNGAAAPTWADLSTLGVNTISFGTTGLTPNSATAGAVTVAGTLVTANGGTGLGGATPFTANGVLYASSASALTSGSALTFDGTDLTFQSAIKLLNNDGSGNKAVLSSFAYGGSGATGTLTLSSTYGNANQQRIKVGVGGAAATSFEIDSSEAMRLTSTGLGIGTSSPGAKLDVQAGATSDATSIRSTLNTNGAAVAGVALYGGNSSGTSVAYSGVYGNIDSNTAGSHGGGMRFYTATSGSFTEKMRIDSSGNLGLGVTPSAWNVGKVMQISTGGAFVFGDSSQFITGVNAYYESGWKYTGTGLATKYETTSGVHQWFTAPSGTAGNAITFTQAMTLDASGNLGIGTTSPTTTFSKSLHVYQPSTGNAGLRVNAGSATGFDFIQNQLGEAFIYNRDNSYIAFGTNNQERARITSGGYFKASNSGTYLNSTGTYHEINQTANDNVLFIRSTDANYSVDGVQLRFNRNTTNNTFYALSYYNDAAAAYKFRIADSGDVTNTNGTYGTISDQKMKTDIVDAGSQWADIKALRFRKFKMKDDPSGLVQLGVVAQEVELTSPGLVDEHQDRDAEGNDLGTTTKSVKTSVLLMKAAVALQEAMARIETLEAKVAQLEGTQP